MNPDAPALLLDTCAVIWFANRGPLRAETIMAIAEAGLGGGVFISPISAWEVGLLTRKQTYRSKPQFLPDAKTWFAMVMNAPGMKLAALTPEIAVDSSSLPGEFHADPADRLLIATARHLRVPIVTRDAKIIAYGEQGMLKVLPC